MVMNTTNLLSSDLVSAERRPRRPRGPRNAGRRGLPGARKGTALPYLPDLL